MTYDLKFEDVIPMTLLEVEKNGNPHSSCGIPTTAANMMSKVRFFPANG